MVEKVVDFLECPVFQFRNVEVAPDRSEERGSAEDKADFSSEIRFVGIDLEDKRSQPGQEMRIFEGEKSSIYGNLPCMAPRCSSVYRRRLDKLLQDLWS